MASLLRPALFVGLIACTATAWAAAPPEPPLSGDAYQRASDAYRALDAGKLADAERDARAALALQPDSFQLQRLLLDILARRKASAEAETLATRLIQTQPQNADLLAQRGYLRQKRGDAPGALADFNAALASDGLPAPQARSIRLAAADTALQSGKPEQVAPLLAPLAGKGDAEVERRLAQAARGADPAPTAASPLDEAYRQLRLKNDRAALASFQQGLNGRADAPAGPLVDAGYTAWRLGENRQAGEYFRQGIDRWYAAPPNARPFDDTLLFDLQRKNQEMTRRWGMVASLAYRGGCFGTECAESGPPYNAFTQLGLEAYWQPESIGYGAGRLFQLYVRGFTTLDDTHTDAIRGGGTSKYFAGARYKPLSDYNLVLSLEHAVYKGGATRSQERAATSLGQPVNGDAWARIGFSADSGVDLKPAAQHWPTWQFFTESAYSLDEHQFIQSLEARWGHSWRWSSVHPDLIVTPHLVIGGDYNSDEILEKTAIGAGPGLSLRQWLRKDRYNAPASWVDLTVQYRFAVNDAKRAAGPYLRLTLWY